MKTHLFGVQLKASRARRLSILITLLVLCLSAAGLVRAQQHISKRYPAGKNLRLELKNISGEVTVESWDRDEIKISAVLESPTAHFSPRQMGDGVIIDVIGENRGRGDVGAVNFKIQLPASSSVDLETRRGDIHVSNVRGGSVRARVSSEGDIDLTGISASRVEASNTMGNIFFDGEFARGGTYQFSSGKGDISIRIPVNSAFHLVASAPTKNIALSQFWNNRFQKIGDGRKMVGDVGDGRSSVTVTTFGGSITFLRK